MTVISRVPTAGGPKAPFHTQPSTEKTLRRETHLELLVFELYCFVMANAPEDAFEDDDQYDRVVELYKALAHGRRPDGSKY